MFEQEVPWHSGKYRAWIHSEMHTWHDKNIQYVNNVKTQLKFDGDCLEQDKVPFSTKPVLHFYLI